MEKDLLTRLRSIYKVPIKPDVFGRRDALPSEVQQVLNRGGGDCKFKRDWDLFLPTELDLEDKSDGKE
jgi:hypothetical protein